MQLRKEKPGIAQTGGVRRFLEQLHCFHAVVLGVPFLIQERQALQDLPLAI